MQPRRRKILRRVGLATGVVLVAAGGVGYWALDEYVIDHVEIQDVAAYEAAARAASEVQTVSAEVGSEDTATDSTAATDATTAEHHDRPRRPPPSR